MDVNDHTERDIHLEKETTSLDLADFAEVTDRIMNCFGRSGSGRASSLRLVGAYLIFLTEGAAGFRKRGFSRDSIQLYREKLHEAGVEI